MLICRITLLIQVVAGESGCKWMKIVQTSRIQIFWTSVGPKYCSKLDVACCFVDHMKNRISNMKSIEIPPKNEEKIFRPPLSFVMMQRYILVKYI